MAKNLYQLEAKLGGYVNGDLAAEASTASIQCVFTDSDDPTSLRAPDPNTKLFEIDPRNTQGKKSEYILCESHSTTDGITTLVNVTRGLQRDATIDLTGSSTRAQQWSSPPIGSCTEPFNLNLIRKYFAGTETIPGNIVLAGNLSVGGTFTVTGISTFGDKIQLTAADTYLDKVGSDMVFKDPSNALTTLSQLTAGAGTDTKFRISAADTTSNFAENKLVAGSGVTLTKNNAGANETLTIAAPANSTYAIDSSGTDAYVANPSTPLTSYTDGYPMEFEPGTSNTGPATVNYSSLGFIPIKKGNYIDLSTGDISFGQKVLGISSVKSVTFTAGLLVAATSGTLTGNWGYKTGVYSVLFSNSDLRDVTLTKGATTATWSGGLSGAATANASARWFEMQTPSGSLSSGVDAGNDHFHLKVTNNDSWLVTGAAQTSVKAHGLGRLPKIVTIYWGTTTSSADLGDLNHGTILYDGTTQRNLRYNSSAAGQGQFGATTGACTVRIDNVAQFSFAVTFDSTNVTLTSSAYSNTKTIDYIWVAE